MHTVSEQRLATNAEERPTATAAHSFSNEPQVDAAGLERLLSADAEVPADLARVVEAIVGSEYELGT